MEEQSKLSLDTGKTSESSKSDAIDLINTSFYTWTNH